MKLREDTASVWEFLRDHPALTGFVLVGGTALTLHIGHRLSEDLDFSFGALRLPRARIEALRRAGREHEIPFVANDDPSAVEAFVVSGMDLNDYQQNYLARDTVKVTFFCPDAEVQVHIAAGAERGPRVATLDEIFAMKCLVSADRSKSRDWFDLYTLMHDHGYTAAQFEAIFSTSRVPQKMDIAITRLCSGRPHQQDEGYESLLGNPPSSARMTEFFLQVADDARAAAAKRRILEHRRDAALAQTRTAAATSATKRRKR
jgi:hypothetical protein